MKKMKKIITVFVMLMMFTAFITGCSSGEVTPITAPIEAVSEENYFVKTVLDTGKWCYENDIAKLVTNSQYSQMAREMSVQIHENGDFDVSMGMSTYRYKFSQDNQKKLKKNNINEESDTAFTNARKRVVSFIENTTWMRDKAELKKYIEEMPLRTADIEYDVATAGQVFALYDEVDNCVYKNTNVSTDMYKECAEHLYTHELVHAVCTKTNGGDVNKRYSFGIFDEIQTEVIALSLGAYESNKYVTLYKQNAPYAYEYFYIYGEEAIKAYFYGYEGFSPKTMRELDAFAESLNACWNEGTNDINIQNEMNMKKGIASTFLIKWALERGVA